MNMKRKTKLANRVFILKEFTLDCQDKNYNLPKINDVGEVRARTQNLGVFSSVKNAEKMIKDWLSTLKSGETLFLGLSSLRRQWMRGFVANSTKCVSSRQ